MATIADYYAFRGKLLPELPEDETVRLNALLDDAAEEVTAMLRFAVYEHDRDGNPTAPSVKKAIIRATCAQALYFEENPRARSEARREYDSIKAGSVALSTNAGSSTGSAKGSTITPRRSQRAANILTAEGLYRATASTTRY